MRSLSYKDTLQQLLTEPMRCKVTVDQLTVDVLPDDVLLKNFFFYVGEAKR